MTWEKAAAIAALITTVVIALRWLWKMLASAHRKRSANKMSFFQGAVEALAFCGDLHQFIRAYWRYGKPLRNYPLSQPEYLWTDRDLSDDARKASAFYQHFCSAQGAVGHSADEAVREWEQIHQSLRAKLERAFRSRWIFWRGKWQAAEDEARRRALGPLLEQRLAIEERRQ